MRPIDEPVKGKYCVPVTCRMPVFESYDPGVSTITCSGGTQS